MADTNGNGTHKVCSTDDVTADKPFVTDIDGSSIAVFSADSGYYALNSECPHQGGPLGEGKVEGDCVYCPWHGWQFDLESGDHVHGRDSAETYEVFVEGDDLFVTL